MHCSTTADCRIISQPCYMVFCRYKSNPLLNHQNRIETTASTLPRKRQHKHLRTASVSSNIFEAVESKQSLGDIPLTLQIIAQGTDRCHRRKFWNERMNRDRCSSGSSWGNPCMLIWPTKHVTSLTLSYKQILTANGIVAIARIHWRTVNVYSFLSVGPIYRAVVPKLILIT